MEKGKYRLSTATKIMISLIPAGLLVILWLNVFSPEKKQPARETSTKSVYIPQKKVYTDTIESKSALYDQEKALYESMEVQKRRDNLSISDIIEITEKRKASEQSERDKLREKLYGQLSLDNKEQEKTETLTKAATPDIKPRVTREKAHSNVEIIDNKARAEKKASTENAAAPVQEDVGYGLGVYNSASESTAKNNADYLTAFLENNIELRQGSEPVFVLKSPGTAGGIKLNKMAILYGIARFESNRWNIYINRALNTDGKYYNVSLVGYNKNMQKGIYYQGRMDNAVNESVNETMETATDVVSEDGVRRILRSGARALELKPQLPLNQGYVMYFKETK